jgi:hypothetical protein
MSRLDSLAFPNIFQEIDNGDRGKGSGFWLTIKIKDPLKSSRSPTINPNQTLFLGTGPQILFG